MPRLTMFIDLLGDTLVDRLRRFIRPKDSSIQHVQDQSPQNAHHRPQGRGAEASLSGSFKHASNFAINNSVMVERVENMFSTGKPVLERLEPYTMADAAMDSSARDPPPKCHPGTRLKISGKLETWLGAAEREWNMMWLHGPAGTGKSAVAQTFAEHCAERDRLGAAFFFSRPNDRNKPETVIPTLAYQLAVHCRDYNTTLANSLANDPQLLKKAPRVQLKKLIIDPLLLLQTHESTCIREPFMIILDGLDECEGERAQFDFVNMINEAAQLEDLPLLWLICSRPEEHLQYTFSRVAYYGREELLLDKECRDDVDRYLRDELARIKAEFRVIIHSPWPSEDQFNGLSKSVSGLFVFASTGLKYIGDPTYANPVERLKKLLSFLNHIDAIGSNNPLASLDLLYTQILTDVPKDVFPTTWRILAHSIWLTEIVFEHRLSARVLCNFLHLDQGAFYGALRKLHSVIAVPAPEDASEARLRFHHASFEDFLSNPNRSGRFVIKKERAFVDIVKSCLFWHNIDMMHFHTDDGWEFDRRHQHASLPHLNWVSPDNEKDVSEIIAKIPRECWQASQNLFDEKDDDLLLLIHSLDFRYIYAGYCFPELANWVSQQYPSDPIVRTEPSNELDMRLLEYLRVVIDQGPANPATFPVYQLDDIVGRRRVYFFVGHGEKTAIVWVTRCGQEWRVHGLTLDKEPSPQQIQVYQDWLVEIKWDEALNDEEWGNSEESLNKG